VSGSHDEKVEVRNVLRVSFLCSLLYILRSVSILGVLPSGGLFEVELAQGESGRDSLEA
jgi:hypothetical protein